MCGRFAMDQDLDDLIAAFVAKGGRPEDYMSHWQAQFSIAPTDEIPIVRERLDDQGELHREIYPATWDFRPAWRKEPRPLINARLETVAEKPTFRAAFTQRRALVPMTGYYERTGTAGNKTPHFIHHEGELLAAAGLYEWRKVDDIWSMSTVVITRTGEDRAGQVHDRMPVFLQPSILTEWLHPEPVGDSAARLSLIDDSSREVAKTLDSHIVDRRVNSVTKVDPHDQSLIVPT